MSDERFNWSRAGKENGCIELKRRNIWRRLTKDAAIYCLVCNKRPKEGEKAYYPAHGLASTNKTIGHVHCVDEVVAKCLPKEKASIIPMPTVPSNQFAPPLSLKAEAAKMERSVSWYEGWYTGVNFILDNKDVDMRSDVEWMSGFKDGIKFASVRMSS